MREAAIQDRIRLELGNIPGLVLWRNNSGVASIGGRTIRYGLGVGSADLVGLYRGRFVSIEVKTETGSQTKEQKLWQALVERNGGIYVILRSAAEARAWAATL